VLSTLIARHVAPLNLVEITLKTDILVDMYLPPVALAMASLIQHYLESRGNLGASTNPSIFITFYYLALPIPELA
jgi:hypothetical protein